MPDAAMEELLSLIQRLHAANVKGPQQPVRQADDAISTWMASTVTVLIVRQPPRKKKQHGRPHT
ncbi:MAG: hypothetical protein ACREIG_07225 [Nitrospiraceae bacterium]